MQIGVFGLGYVGSVSAACLASDGWRVLGIDQEPRKARQVGEGKAPVIEAELGDVIGEAVAAGRLRTTTDASMAVAETDISMICVGTPSQKNGDPDLKSVVGVCETIGSALRQKDGYHTIVIRSTVLPGTVRDVVLPTLEKASGKRAGADFGLAHNPEFLREGTAIHDYYNPPKTVIGALDDRSGTVVAELYAKLDAPLIRTSIEVAEIVKYVDNAWHALKVSFGNEIGNISKALGIDSHEVMDIFCQDTKLNLSPTYLKPGFAFGGSCLPKDLRALTYKARRLDLDVPVLNSILPSNRAQVERALQMLVDMGRRRVGVLGLSFKFGTDDVRESPLVALIEVLIGKGYDLRIYDHNVNLALLVGSNREYLLTLVPHIATFLVDTVDEILEHGEVIIIGNNDPSFHDVPTRLKSDQILFDLVRVPSHDALAGRYDGINW